MPYNPEKVKELLKSFYILGFQQFSPALSHRTQAEPEAHDLLTTSGYSWDEETQAYKDNELGQMIVALPGDQYIWIYGELGKVLKNPEKLNIWLSGRGEQFVLNLLNASGQGDPINFKGTGHRSHDYVPSSKDETEMLIAKLTRQAGKSKTLPGDLMIDLGRKAKEEKNDKLLAFLKTINPMEENTIKRSQLNNLVREIIKNIVNEGITGGWEEERQERERIYSVANKAWGKNNWRVKNQKTSPDGTVYQMTFNMPATLTTRFLWQTPKGEWKALDPNTKKWNIIDASEMDEMSVTGGVAPISTPFAFKKKKGPMEEGKIQDPTKEEMLDYLRSEFGNEEGFEGDAEAAMYWFANFNHGGQSSNLYSVLSTSDYEPGPIRNAPVPDSAEEMMYQSLEDAFGNPGEGQVDEITTTGNVAGYNIPAAFSRRGGSEKGIKGSESLGYTLTPQGQKEMNRKADRLYTEEVQEVLTEKADYADQITMAWKKAKKDRDAEAMAYYESLQDTSASVPFDKFKGSWAYGEWINKPEVKQHIENIKASFKTAWTE